MLLVTELSRSRLYYAPWEDTLPRPYPASPPICFVVRLLQDGNDLALLEAQVTWLIRIECEFSDSLVGSQACFLCAKDRLGC